MEKRKTVGELALRVKVAMIGCGAVAERYHLPALTRIPEIQIVALADTNTARAEKLKGLYSLTGAKVSSDYHDLLEDQEIGAVMILAPPQYHEKIAVDAAETGKHIFLEKPIALTLEGAKRVSNAVEQSGVKLMVGCNLRYQKQFSTAHELAKKGFAGDLRTLICSYLTDIRRWRPVSGFLQRRQEGGGAWMDTGYHVADLMNWFLGSPKSILCKITLNSAGLDNAASGIVEYKQGSCALFSVSWLSAADITLRAEGDHGLVFADAFLNDVWVRKKGAVSLRVERWTTIAARSIFSSHHAELSDFVNCIRRNRRPTVGASEGVSALSLVLAGYQSAASSRMTEIST